VPQLQAYLESMLKRRQMEMYWEMKQRKKNQNP